MLAIVFMTGSWSGRDGRRLLLLVALLLAAPAALGQVIFQDDFENFRIGFKDCPECPTMVALPAGSFVMGSAESEPGSESWERPQHEVSVPAFAIGKFEVTFEQWDVCAAAGYCTPDVYDANWGGGPLPVISVNWHEAQQFVHWLSVRTGEAYRLPTEAEWEYATRAGTTSLFNTGDCITAEEANVDLIGTLHGCSTAGDYQHRTLPVGSFEPNPFGLYDTHGNVLEWVQDCWNPSYDGAPTDGSAWMSGDCEKAVLRGGSHDHGNKDSRSAYRFGGFRTLDGFDNWGFRVAKTLAP